MAAVFSLPNGNCWCCPIFSFCSFTLGSMAFPGNHYCCFCCCCYTCSSVQRDALVGPGFAPSLPPLHCCFHFFALWEICCTEKDAAGAEMVRHEMFRGIRSCCTLSLKGKYMHREKSTFLSSLERDSKAEEDPLYFLIHLENLVLGSV